MPPKTVAPRRAAIRAGPLPVATSIRGPFPAIVSVRSPIVSGMSRLSALTASAKPLAAVQSISAPASDRMPSPDSIVKGSLRLPNEAEPPGSAAWRMKRPLTGQTLNFAGSTSIAPRTNPCVSTARQGAPAACTRQPDASRAASSPPLRVVGASVTPPASPAKDSCPAPAMTRSSGRLSSVIALRLAASVRPATDQLERRRELAARLTPSGRTSKRPTSMDTDGAPPPDRATRPCAVTPFPETVTHVPFSAGETVRFSPDAAPRTPSPMADAVKAVPSVFRATPISASNLVSARLSEARRASAWPASTPGRLKAAPVLARRSLSSAAPLAVTLPSKPALPSALRCISPASESDVTEPAGPVTMPVDAMKGPDTSPARPASSPLNWAALNV